jgi:ABC-type phosphate/phosphonate transport system substrate-binding protein
MGAGAAVVVRELFDAGRVDGVLAVGGSGGSSIAARVMANSGHLPAYGLHQVGIDPNSGINAMYLGTHTAVFQALLAGRVDAAELASTQIAAATSAHQYDPAHLRMLRPRRPRRRTRSWCAAT